MPIPPRPIPVHHPRHSHHRQGMKPGSSVPRKSGITSCSSSLEWRAEIALLNELGPKSVPLHLTGTAKGVKMVDTKSKSKDREMEERGEGKMEVGLRELIDDGRGKREKRATTATTLGFDFIPNPTILTLPDDAPAIQDKKSLLTISKSIPTHVQDASTPLENTPITPGLLPRPSSSLDPEAEEEDDEDWEHVPSLTREEGERVDEDEHDIIILGELELDDVDDSIIKDGDAQAIATKGNGQKISYAGILGTRS
ncbi:hypothetical protein I302_108119 [Kwoniella bestiolae CBS 10118]|uniref:Uncharacterized protein n=1 Tax=Kwoniella bestiolae CBS 10118 TaxID=1296100 RepID=A0A1B9FWL9_9TREE|nr:hypothetical protein I302_07516 [Kwoniella bestiolae CBS 10118]OCF23163.1 hypothetical protein I302_07516 [Kwoniella bestiolae CBS 10118]